MIRAVFQKMMVQILHISQLQNIYFLQKSQVVTMEAKSNSSSESITS